jgi:hypothetical protein
MKIISIDNGRTTWLLPAEEFMPLGGGDGKAVIKDVAERYSFSHAPVNPTREEIEKSGLKFSAGQMHFEGENVTIGEFTAYNDGIVANSVTTERATAFLEDIFGYLIDRFGFREPVSPIKKINVSTVIVEFDETVSAMLAKQKAITDIVAAHLNEPQGTSDKVELYRLDFVLDNSPLEKPTNLPRLILEARATVPISQRRYYSNAAVHTKSHLKMLEEIEAVFTNRR